MAPPAPSSRSRASTAAASVASVAGLLGTLYYLDIPSILQQRVKAHKVQPRCYHAGENVSLARFRTHVEQVTLKETYPLAATIEKNIPIYDCTTFDLSNVASTNALQDEFAHILTSGPGVFVLKSFFPNTAVIDSTNAIYDAIIAAEASSGHKGDHFAPSSANSRIWNSLFKHCQHDPVSFLEYYSNPLLRLVSTAALGPGAKLTAQVNIVRPGGQPQVCHRDYHLGFQTAADTAQYPKTAHLASQFLTLQGAVAHSHMPLASGPTRLLPYSQLCEEGYLAYRMPEFNDYFSLNHVSLPVQKGDAVFFSPALFHAAGANTTSDVARSANLLQISSAFGKPMESVDSLPLVRATWESLREKFEKEGMSLEVEAFVCAVGEAYPFPTNLDRRPPGSGGLAPENEQEVLRRGLKGGWGVEEVMGVLEKMRKDDRA